MQRTHPEGGADDRAVLTGWLDWQRATVRLKVEGLSEQDGYRSLVATSPRMTVAGVVSHLRDIERGGFAGRFPSIVGRRDRDVDGRWDFILREQLDGTRSY